jgi:hypothetical protein
MRSSFAHMQGREIQLHRYQAPQQASGGNGEILRLLGCDLMMRLRLPSQMTWQLKYLQVFHNIAQFLDRPWRA